jgi:2-oxoglutarate ferredoxin oxidoreductase subunit beta
MVTRTKTRKKTEQVAQKYKGYEKYIRYDTFPNQWCPGCGNGVVLKTIAMALDELNIDPNDVVVVSGIGCSGRMSTFFNTNTLHTTHGRPLTFATGIKMAQPDKTVIVISGDGDATSIGGNHLIHAARRNIGIKLILINNGIYGMTGGQVSPTTIANFYTETTPYGNFEPNFDVVDLLKGARASFIARESAFRLVKLKQTIRKSFEHDGFSTVEVLSNCHVNLGRRNKMRKALDMKKFLEEVTYPIERADKMTEEEKAGKYPLGIFVNDVDRPEYSDIYYNQLVPIAQGSMKKEK